MTDKSMNDDPMNDKDLSHLKNIQIPEASDAARIRALEAAMSAFSEQQMKKMQDAPQGKESWARLISMNLKMIEEWIMGKRLIIGSATASVIVVSTAVAVYVNTSAFRGGEQAPGEPVAQQMAKLDERKEPQPLQNSEQDANKSSAPAKTDGLVKAEDKAQSGTEERAVEQKGQPGLPEGFSGEGIIAEQAKLQPDVLKPVQTEPVGRLTAEIALPQHAAPAGERSKQQNMALAKPAPTQERKKPDTLRRQGLTSEVLVDREAPLYIEQQNRDRFADYKPTAPKAVSEHPVSTFSIDVDTSSYSYVRRQLNEGVLPQASAIRLEEMINYFSYDYARPDTAEQPFKANVALYPTPWNKETKLLHIGIKGHDIVRENKPRSNLVFLIDVSGSMNEPDKLPLLKKSFKMLVERLDEKDSVAIVVYAGSAGAVLEPTKGTEKKKILAALDRLQAGGSTAGAQGIEQAYALAESVFDKDGVNRVILATDGDFNVGMSSDEELKKFIENKRKSGIFLSVLGFGQGNYNDGLMQTLAQNGNGTAAYIDTLREAQKVLVEEAGSTLFPIAKDVKIQIEFNPALVSEYRLIGYETRALNREDFNNDKVDAGEIGSGHTVTAIYEITPVGSKAKQVDDLRYKKPDAESKPVGQGEKQGANGNEYAFLKLRYKLPKEDESKLITLPVTRELEKENIAETSDDIRFAASVAAFGQKLQGNLYIKDLSYDDIHKLASDARGKDEFGYRSEFLSLIRLAKSLDHQEKGTKK